VANNIEQILTWHSTKCPILAFAITGIVTASMISLIIFGSDMRATPPSLRMSAGTRSRAITAQAPASSAILACGGVSHWPDQHTDGLDVLTCSAFMTSIITPPFNMRARPVLTVKLASPLDDSLAEPLVLLVGSSVAIFPVSLSIYFQSFFGTGAVRLEMAKRY
jgi:hypothetical protein